MSSLPFLITPEAEEDLAETKAWYNRPRPGLGDDFILCVQKAGVASPLLLAVPAGGRRGLSGSASGGSSGGSRNGVFYRNDPDQIAVIAVYHSRRDPTGWQVRV